VAVLLGRHRAAVDTLQRLRERWAPRVRVLVTAALALGALVLLADVLSWAAGSFLVGD
jgi:hypothetical protein